MTFLQNEEDIKMARDGYEVFFEAFIRNNPRKYISFDDFVYKHFASGVKPKTHVVFAYHNEKPVAMQWYMPVSVLCADEEYQCVQAADTAATNEGRGATFLKMYISGEKRQAEDGVAFRYGTPNENSMRFTEKLGSVILGCLCSASLGEVKTCQNNLSSLSGSLLDQITMQEAISCPFSPKDFDRLNANTDCVKVKRTAAYYTHRVDGLPGHDFTYITARAGEDLLGLFLLEGKSGSACSLWDWYIADDEFVEKATVVSLLIQKVFQQHSSIRVPLLNPASADAALFEACGFRLNRTKEGEIAGNNFAFTPFQDGLSKMLLDVSKWEIKLIDLDWSLNCYQRY